MAVFYLNVRNGQELVRDTNAYSFPTAQAARDATERTVRALIATEPDFAKLDKSIEIADATGHPVSVISAHDVAPDLCPAHVPDY